MPNTGFWTDANVNRRINVHTRSVYNLIREASPPDYYSTDNTINTVVNTIAYTLPSDFLDIQQVLVNDDSNHIRPLRRMNDDERGYYQGPQGVYTVTLQYTPTFAGFANDNSTFDGVSGWEDLIIRRVARDMLQKEESDVSVLTFEIQELESEIRAQVGKRDNARPARMTDVDNVRPYPFLFAVQGLDAYRLRGSNIEFYSRHTVWP